MILTEQHPDLHITAVSKLIGAKWATLTDEDKAPFQERSRIAKIGYLKSLGKKNNIIIDIKSIFPKEQV